MINQFDNAIPKIASRAGDPPTMARQLAAGYLGLQTHGGNDRISYREMQVKEIAPADIPVNTVAPTVTGTGYIGQPLTCNPAPGPPPRARVLSALVPRRTRSPPTHPRFRAPSQLDYSNTTTPADPAGTYGNQALTWLDSQIVDEDTNSTYTPTQADVGKDIHCTVDANNSGATVWKTAAAPEIQVAATQTARRHRAGDAGPDARHAGRVRRVHRRRRA